MIPLDHVFGRPSVKFRKIQVFTVVSFWSLYLYKYGLVLGDALYRTDMMQRSSTRPLVPASTVQEPVLAPHGMADTRFNPPLPLRDA